MENTRKGKAKRIPMKKTSSSVSAGLGLVPRIMKITKNFNPLSLNAPWNCVTIRLHKPSRHFFSGRFRDGDSELGIRADQSSGLKGTEIERFYQRFLQPGHSGADSVPKTRRQGYINVSQD